MNILNIEYHVLEIRPTLSHAANVLLISSELAQMFCKHWSLRMAWSASRALLLEIDTYSFFCMCFCLQYISESKHASFCSFTQNLLLFSVMLITAK